MKITIIGAGTIGSNLARHLADEKHEVYLVESNPDVALKAHEKLDVKVIVGEGSDPDILQAARASEAGLVVAVTSSDDTNLVVCALADAFGAERKIARLRGPALNKVIKKFGHDSFHIDEIINPELITADSIIKIINTPGSSEVADFAGGRMLLRSFDITGRSPICNLRLYDQKLRNFPLPFLIVAIRNNGSLIFPRGDTMIREGDRIYVLFPEQSHDEFLTFVNPGVKKARKIVIYGATDIGKSVASALVGSVREVMVLEENTQKAEEIADQIDSIRVIKGSALESDILKECGIGAADAFIAVTESDHSNLVSAVLAKKMGAKTTMITTCQNDFQCIIEALKVDVVINPNVLATYQILRLVRGASIRHVAKLMDCGAEVLELIPEAGAPITRAKIRDIKFPENAIAGAISRDKESLLVDGNIQIQAGEPVIVFCQDEAVQKLQGLFTKKKLV